VRFLGACVLMAGSASPALAQTPRVAVGVGGTFSTAVSTGTTEATLIDSAGGSLVVFRAANRIASGSGVEGLVSVKVRDRVRAEFNVGWVATKFESEISGDIENADVVTATQKVNQYTADVALTWRLLERGRLALFLRGGAGGFREITADRALVDNGWRMGGGVGTQIRLRQASSGWLGRIAARVDVRVNARRGGIEFGHSGSRMSTLVFAGLVFGQ